MALLDALSHYIRGLQGSRTYNHTLSVLFSYEFCLDYVVICRVHI